MLVLVLLCLCTPLQVDKVYFCAAIDKYITCSRDGTFRLWQAADLDYVKTVNNGSSWITDCLYLPYSRKMVFTTMDRAITYYDITRCVCEGRLVVHIHTWSICMFYSQCTTLRRP